MTNGPFSPEDLDADALLQQMRGGSAMSKLPKMPMPVRETPSGSLAGPAAPPVIGTTPGTSNTMPVDGPAPSVTPGPAPAAPPGVSASVFQGFTPRHAMEGFAFDREQNTGKSAKDAFAMLANQAPPPPINDKAALGAWFQQYIAPGMNSLGHNVSNVEGDKFRLNNWQGQFDVDYGRGAGADGGALAWQVDDGTAQMANGPYQPRGAVREPTSDAPVREPTTDESDPMAEILAEIEALQGGGVSPMDSRALLELLQG